MDKFVSRKLVIRTKTKDKTLNPSLFLNGWQMPDVEDIGKTGGNHITEHCNRSLNDINLTSLNFNPFYRQFLTTKLGFKKCLRQYGNPDDLPDIKLQYRMPSAPNAMYGR